MIPGRSAVVMLQKSNMNCVNLSLLHHKLSRGDCWMKQCVCLLRNFQYFSFYRTYQSNDKGQQILSLSSTRRQIQSFRFENNEEGQYKEGKTSSPLQGEKVTQTAEDAISYSKKVCSSDDGNLGHVHYHVAARHCMPQAAVSHGKFPKSPPSLFSSSVICCEHFLKTFRSRMIQSSAMYPAAAIGCSLFSPLGLNNTVRFYRGQSRSHISHKTTRRNQGSEENYGTAHEDTDGQSGSEDEAISEFPVARNETGQISLNDLDAIEETTELTEAVQRNDLVKRKPADEMTLPELSRASFNIVPYVKRSVTLQNLVRLGVDLSRVEKVAGVAEHLIKSDFNRHIVPFLKLLVMVGVEADKIGHIFTANPLLFLENVQDLEIRIGYLLHKKFTLAEIAEIVTNSPVTLLMDPLMLDEKLAFLQNVFILKENEVRQVVKKYPKILPWKKELLADVKFHVKEFMGFTDSDISQLILKDPRIFMSGKGSMVSRFDYLYNHMMISHQQILTWPTILRTRLFVIKNRHLFLLYLNRAQYDPYKENYVSLQALAKSSDEQFCQTVAKCSVQDFYDFCKTL